MGKGDKKSRKGKIALGTYGNSRKKKSVKSRLNKSVEKKAEGVSEVEVKVEAPVKAKKAPRKKAEA